MGEETQTPEGDKSKEGGAATQPTEKMIPERDLIAVKEGAKKELKDLKTAHKAELDSANTGLSEIQQKLLQAEASVEKLGEAATQSSGSAEELEKVKTELVTAQKRSEELGNKALEYRRSIVVATYGIPADTIKDKTTEELDQFESALKAVSAAKGVGNYAVGGGGGASAPESPQERAKRILAEADARRGGSKE